MAQYLPRDSDQPDTHTLGRYSSKAGILLVDGHWRVGDTELEPL